MARKSPQSFEPVKRYGTRTQLTALYQEQFGLPLSPRSLERWPLPWRVVNGRAICGEAEFLAEANRRISSAPVVMGGSKIQKAA